LGRTLPSCAETLDNTTSVHFLFAEEVRDTLRVFVEVNDFEAVREGLLDRLEEREGLLDRLRERVPVRVSDALERVMVTVRVTLDEDEHAWPSQNDRDAVGVAVNDFDGEDDKEMVRVAEAVGVLLALRWKLDETVAEAERDGVTLRLGVRDGDREAD
jgi:hypothetical protein